MTYVSLEQFVKCMKIGNVHIASEYHELWDRGIVPTKLMPRDPGSHKSPYQSKAGRNRRLGTWKNGVFTKFTVEEQAKIRKDRMVVYGKEYYDKNKKKILTRIKKFNKSNPDRKHLAWRKYHALHRDEINAKAKAKRLKA